MALGRMTSIRSGTVRDTAVAVFSQCICCPFKILKWQRMAGTWEFLCSQALGWSKLSSTQVLQAPVVTV